MSHRTKRQKRGRIAGLRGTVRMYRDLFGLLRPWGDIRWRAYWWYLRGLTIARPERVRGWCRRRRPGGGR